MKKNNFILIAILSLLFIFHASHSTPVHYEEDVKAAKTRSLISGIELDKLHAVQAKAAITLGFKNIGVGVKHAYLVFETPISDKQQNKEIFIQGVHFGGAGGYYEPGTIYGAVYGGGKGIIYEESDKEVIMKFIRAKRIDKPKINERGIQIKDTENFTELPGTYEKHISFIVDVHKAYNALNLISKDKDEGTYFSLKGWGITDKDKTYNCTSYIVKLLKEAGVELLPAKATDLKIDHNYLESRIQQYKTKSLEDRKGIEIMTPPAAQDLLR